MKNNRTENNNLECPICKTGKMIKQKDIMEQDGIEFENFKCNSCGEEIMNMKQLKALATKYRKLRKAKEITFSKWGNSLAVRIPSEIVDDFRLSAGKHGLLTKEKEGIMIIPAV